jgi:hypothetical protein
VGDGFRNGVTSLAFTSDGLIGIWRCQITILKSGVRNLINLLYLTKRVMNSWYLDLKIITLLKSGPGTLIDLRLKFSNGLMVTNH